MPKKLLSTILAERLDSIEYRSVRKQLMRLADQGKRSYRIIRLEPKTITALQNEGLTVNKLNEYGYKIWEITGW